MVYYAHAVACILVFALWILAYDDQPAHSHQVSPKELSKIQLNKTHEQTEGKTVVPYKVSFG
jgi:hypothetical protein